MSIGTNELVSYSVRVGNGSGCLYQPRGKPYSLVLTAKHVIEDSKGYDVKRLKADKDEGIITEDITIVQPYMHPNEKFDAAILKVEKVDDIDELSLNYHIVCEEKNNCFLTGHPGVNYDDYKPGRNVKGKKDNNFTYSPFRISEFLHEAENTYVAASLKSFNKNTDDIKGASGGGIIEIKDNKILLSGIQSSMPVNQNGTIFFMPISFFNEILDMIEFEEIEKLEPLEPNAILIYITRNSNIYFKKSKIIRNFEISQELSQDVFKILQRLLFEDKLENDEFEVLGTSLFNRLFSNDTARKEFYSLISSSQEDREPLKIILRFDEESSELACLPWEYLYCKPDKSKGYFLGSKEKLILTRRLFYPGKSAVPENTELKVLIAVSNHFIEGLNEAKKIQREEYQIKQAIEDISNQSNIKCEKVDPLHISSLEDLAASIKVNKCFYHCVHFIGLVRKEDDKYEVAFADKNKTDKSTLIWKDPKGFISCFGNTIPKLIFLHADRDSNMDTYLELSGFAFHLAKEVDGVLAIQAPAGNLNAENFSKLIYTSLIKEGVDLDLAVKKLLWDAASEEKVVGRKPKTYGMNATFSRQALSLKINKRSGENKNGNGPIKEIDFCQGKIKIPLKKSEKCNEEILIIDGKPNMARCDNCNTLTEQCPFCHKLINPSWKEEEKKCFRCDKPFTAGDFPVNKQSDIIETDPNKSKPTESRKDP